MSIFNHHTVRAATSQGNIATVVSPFLWICPDWAAGFDSGGPLARSPPYEFNPSSCVHGLNPVLVTTETEFDLYPYCPRMSRVCSLEPSFIDTQPCAADPAEGYFLRFVLNSALVEVSVFRVEAICRGYYTECSVAFMFRS